MGGDLVGQLGEQGLLLLAVSGLDLLDEIIDFFVLLGEQGNGVHVSASSAR
jgi:hypothetical protein